ncbi:MAG TPA: isoprenylcysteine carboxylmethyltransferase family protein [Thermoanaerobaculia bacterium]|nr:isoprenylcysteine carboxylmethyltransferase family protein [Thermoanaerobaculia bacterium]
MMFIRHLLSFLALPFVVGVVVPIWIARRNGIEVAWPGWPMLFAGIVVLGVGVLLFAASLWEFVTRGRGTLAPWDPPRSLVVHGPYRYVRNPMISGLLFVLAAEAILLRSSPHAGWFLTFLVINAIYIPLMEEPMLADRFGDSYREYCRNVPRVIPRLTPWPSSSHQPPLA